MNVATLLTRVKNVVQGRDVSVEKVLDDALIYHYIDEAVRELKKEFKIPIKEQDMTMVADERGVVLPTDFMQLIDEHSVRFIENGSDAAFEGYIFPIFEDSVLNG